MRGRFVAAGRLIVVIFALVLCFPRHASAQRVEDSCSSFFNDPHQSLDCIEALFTQTDIPYGFPHLTVSSIPGAVAAGVLQASAARDQCVRGLAPRPRERMLRRDASVSGKRLLRRYFRQGLSVRYPKNNSVLLPHREGRTVWAGTRSQGFNDAL